MTAYFSSKFKKQVQTAFAAVLLLFCLQGTHWIGLSHSISHAHAQSQFDTDSISVTAIPSISHSSDTCHLFDALTLAGFIAADPSTTIAGNNFAYQSSVTDTSLLAQTPAERYQSRAPPIFHL